MSCMMLALIRAVGSRIEPTPFAQLLSRTEGQSHRQFISLAVHACLHDAARLYLQDSSHVQVTQSLSATPKPSIAKPPECEARRCNWGCHSLQKPDGAHRVLLGLVIAAAFDWNPVHDPRHHSGIHWIFSLQEGSHHQRACPRVDRHHFRRDWTSGLGSLLSHDNPQHDRWLACRSFSWVGREHHADQPGSFSKRSRKAMFIHRLIRHL